MVNKVTETMKSNYIVLSNLIELKKQKNESKNRNDCYRYNVAFKKAMSRFGYIVDMHSVKYKSFPNYQDIVQEGKIGLAFALEKFDPDRSKNFFKIANWYVKTRIKRSANKHCVVNTPLSATERVTINRMQDLALIIENRETPLDSFEKEELFLQLRNAVNSLDNPYKTVVCLYYGINMEDLESSNKLMTINKISRMLKIDKEEVEEMLEEAHRALARDKQLLCLLEER